MILRMLLAAVIFTVTGCGPAATVETPKEPIRELTVKPNSGPPPG